MADLGSGPATEPMESRGDWRTDLRRWALAQRAILQRRPWLTRLPVAGPPRGPNVIGWMDAGLRYLRDTDLDRAAKVGVITVVSGYVRKAFVFAGELEAGSHAAGLERTQVEQNYGRDLAELVDPARFPMPQGYSPPISGRHRPRIPTRISPSVSNSFSMASPPRSIGRVRKTENRPVSARESAPSRIFFTTS
ncbi:TetR/AcrR family transcriptional regulator C-terminal domain-containing protein [Nocardia sp. CA-129566]|uniref:TetR/AcrR family transcriptional regulator C-terminal domain-containing protein n=1 Tax=Nocardia sp. CA-129566 TaxID=3239976 RepID=UPI003D960F22